MESKDLGSIATNGKYYSPKYWVLKWKNSDDVAIETASKSLSITKSKAEEMFTEEQLKNDYLYEYILIEIKKVIFV